MGNDFSRKPLLPVFSHLGDATIEEVEERYLRYRKVFKSQPFLSRVEYSKLFFADDVSEDKGDRNESETATNARKERERVKAFLTKKNKTDPVADVQYAYLDRFKRQRISALDIFAGLGLICHESMDGRLKFVHSLVDFGQVKKINHAELVLMISAGLRGIARFKGVRDAQMWEADQIARNVFVQAGVNLRAGEGVGDYAEGGVTVEHLVTFCRKDVKARALLDNINSGAYLSGLLQQQQEFLARVIDIEIAIQIKQEREHVDRNVQILAQNAVNLFLLTDAETKDQDVPSTLTSAAGMIHDPNEEEQAEIPGASAFAMNAAVRVFKRFGVYSPNVMTSLVHKRLFLRDDTVPSAGEEDPLSLVVREDAKGTPDATYLVDDMDVPKPEIMGVWKLSVGEDGKKKYQHIITGEFVPEVPPFDSRDAEEILKDRAVTFIQRHLKLEERKRLKDYLRFQKASWWLSVDNFQDAACGADIILSRREAEELIVQLTSSDPPARPAFTVEGLVDAPQTNNDEGEKVILRDPVVLVETEDRLDESDVEGDGEDEESEDEDEENKIYFGRFEQWLTRTTKAKMTLHRKHQTAKNEAVIKRKQERDQMIQRRSVRRMIKKMRAIEEQKRHAEAEEARRRLEAAENGGESEEEEDEDANLSFAERAQKRAYKKLHKLRREGNEFVMTSREKHAMEDMLAGYNAQGALDLAEKRKNADALEQVKSNPALDRLNRMVAKYPPPPKKVVEKALVVQKEPEPELSPFQRALSEKKARREAKLAAELEAEIEQPKEQNELATNAPPPSGGGLLAKMGMEKYAWEEDTDNELDDAIIATELDFRHAIPMYYRGLHAQLNLRRWSLILLHWSRDLSDEVKWRRRYQRLALGWEDYAMEHDAEATTRHTEDSQSDFDCGPRQWGLEMHIDPPYRTVSIPGYTKRDIDADEEDTVDTEATTVADPSQDGKDNARAEGHGDSDSDASEVYASEEDSDSDDEMPVPPPKPKIVIEVDINKCNPEAMSAMEALAHHVAETNQEGGDGSSELWPLVREMNTKKDFSLRSVLLRKYSSLPIAFDQRDDASGSTKKTRGKSAAKIKHVPYYNADMEHMDREDCLDESDMIPNRVAGFYVDLKCNKETASVEDIVSLASSIQALLEIPVVARAYSTFAHSPRADRVISFGEQCIRITFALHPDADPFTIFARMAGQPLDELFSEELPTGNVSHVNQRKKNADNGGITLFSHRVEVNVDIGEAFDLTKPFVEHHVNTVRWNEIKHEGVTSYARGLTDLAKRCVKAIFTTFDKDKDGALSYAEVNSMNERVRVPLFQTPSDYIESVSVDKFDCKRAGAGIGLSLKGLEQAYAMGEGDLGRDMSLLNLGSLSHFLKAVVYSKVESTESFGRRLMDPMGAPLMPGRSNSTFQKWVAAMFRYGRKCRLSMRAPSLYATLNKYCNISYEVDDDGAPKHKTFDQGGGQFGSWLAWLVGHPGAFAEQILRIRQTFESDIIEMRQFMERAKAEGWDDGDHDTVENTNLTMAELEAKAERQDYLDMARILVRMHELMRRTLDELTAIVFVSDDLSFHCTIAGLDIVRCFYDLPMKVQPESPQEIKYRQRKEEKRLKKERNREAIKAIREAKRKKKKEDKMRGPDFEGI